MLKNTTTSLTQNILRIILGAFMLFAGISHLTFNRIEFQAQVPDWLPFSKDFVVLASGVVEIIFGLAIIFLQSQRANIGLALALFFVLIYLGNISQYLNHTDAFGALNSDKARLIRLFFQPVLIAWALWSTGAWKAWRKK